MDYILLAEIFMSISLIICLVTGKLPSKTSINYNYRKNKPVFYWSIIIAYFIILLLIVNSKHFELNEPKYQRYITKTNGDLLLKKFSNTDFIKINSANIVSENGTICSDLNRTKKGKNTINIRFNNCSLYSENLYTLDLNITNNLYLKELGSTHLVSIDLHYPKNPKHHVSLH